MYSAHEVGLDNLSLVVLKKVVNFRVEFEIFCRIFVSHGISCSPYKSRKNTKDESCHRHRRSSRFQSVDVVSKLPKVYQNFKMLTYLLELLSKTYYF